MCGADFSPIARSTSIERDNHHGAGGRGRHGFSCIAFGILIFVALALSRSARGHGSEEFFPQQPPLEQRAACEPYDVLLTCSPGAPVPGEPASLVVSIKHRQTLRDYVEPITLRILQKRTFGDNAVILPPVRLDPMEVDIAGLPHHTYCIDFPAPGKYMVELSMVIDGRTKVIPFDLTAGETTGATGWALLIASLIVILFVMVRAVQVKRRRRAVTPAGVLA